LERDTVKVTEELPQTEQKIVDAIEKRLDEASNGKAKDKKAEKRERRKKKEEEEEKWEAGADLRREARKEKDRAANRELLTKVAEERKELASQARAMKLAERNKVSGEELPDAGPTCDLSDTFNCLPCSATAMRHARSPTSLTCTVPTEEV
jgi:hypothetical protein